MLRFDQLAFEVGFARQRRFELRLRLFVFANEVVLLRVQPLEQLLFELLALSSEP